MPTANALPGRTHWTRCLAARTGRGEISQAGKHTSSKRRYHTNTKRSKMKKMLHFVETTHEVAETVKIRQYVRVPVKSRVPVLQNEDSSCSIRECNASNTASTPNISDVCTAAAAVDTACARGSVLLITASMSIRTRAVSRNDNISDVCTAAAVDTACSRGSVLLITYWCIYQHEYVQGHCLSR